MKDAFTSHHWSDNEGRPEGGVSCGTGFTVSWQNGPLGRVGTDERREPNGAFVETIIDVAIDRLNYYQSSPFACQENHMAITYLGLALECLNKRTQRRTQDQTEGTHEGN